MTETHGPTSGRARPSTTLRRYPARAGDEAFMASGEPRPVYRPIFEVVEKIGMIGLSERLRERDRWASEAGMTFGVEGRQLPFPADLVPRAIPAHEWSFLSSGLEQRARALELFLRDIYGEAKIVADGVLPPDVVHDAPGWRDEARLLPPGVVRAPIMGFDLVRNELGGWRVLEDNVRVPSGAGYAIALRQVLDEVMPMLPRPEGLLDPSGAATQLRSTLLACAGSPEATIALLSDGAGNSAWFEHQLLAEQAGFMLVQPGDLEVDAGQVVALGHTIDLLYLRLDVELVDLSDERGRNDRRGRHGGGGRGQGHGWPTRRATAWPTTRRRTAGCPT